MVWFMGFQCISKTSFLLVIEIFFYGMKIKMVFFSCVFRLIQKNDIGIQIRYTFFGDTRYRIVRIGNSQISSEFPFTLVCLIEKNFYFFPVHRIRSVYFMNRQI